MTASQKAKAMGLKTLTQVSKIVRKSPQTLDNWSKQSPELFEAVLLGCAQKLPKKKCEKIYILCRCGFEHTIAITAYESEDKAKKEKLACESYEQNNDYPFFIEGCSDSSLKKLQKEWSKNHPLNTEEPVELSYEVYSIFLHLDE